jgi:hypothetical protein
MLSRAPHRKPSGKRTFAALSMHDCFAKRTKFVTVSDTLLYGLDLAIDEQPDKVPL